MNIPNDLLYTEDHEWIRIVNDIATLGVTEFAQAELGDIIFIEFPEKGTKFESSDSIGTIEAVKTVADIFTPIAGEILEVNVVLEENPELIYTLRSDLSLFHPVSVKISSGINRAL